MQKGGEYLGEGSYACVFDLEDVRSCCELNKQDAYNFPPGLDKTKYVIKVFWNKLHFDKETDFIKIIK